MLPTQLPITGPPPATLRDELRALLRLASPLVAANLLQMTVYAVDVIFVAQLGTTEFAAATLGVFLFSLIMWALASMVAASAPIIASELGARKHAVREVRRTFRMAMWLAVAAAVPFVVLLAYGEDVLRLAGQDARVAARAGAFLDILLYALLPGVLAAAMRGTAAALGRSGWAMAVTVLALALALLTNWLFVFGHGGFPALGLEGSALASVVTMTAMALAYAAILAFDPKLRRYRLFGRWWRPEWPRLRAIAILGAPIALSVTFEAGLFGGASLLMGLIGVEAVAAHAVALNIASVAFQIPYGVAQAATIRVGLGYGARDAAWIGRAGVAALGVGIGAMAFTASLMWLMPRVFVGAYIDVDAPANARVVMLAIDYLAVAAAFQLVDGAQAVAAGLLRGLQDTRVPMLVSLFGYWVVGFGTAVLLAFRFDLAGLGVWIGLATGLAAVTVLLLWRWRGRGALGLLPRPN
ncbi:MATE family efflux transporter [Sphingomonas sp.]|uniref:MATE family efflux transporter n=1 Tax=Sphingomonas sp. TaxID=28214 RepID=UPI002ED8016B